MSGETAQEGWLATLKAMVHEGATKTGEEVAKAGARKTAVAGVESVVGEFATPLASAGIGAALEFGISATQNVIAYAEGKKTGGEALADTVEKTLIGAASGAAAGVGGMAGKVIGGAVGEAIVPEGGGVVGEAIAGPLVGIGTGVMADLALNRVAETPEVEEAKEGVAHKLDSAWDAAKGFLTGGSDEPSPAAVGGAGAAPAIGNDGGGAGGAPPGDSGGDAGVPAGVGADSPPPADAGGAPAGGGNDGSEG